MERMKSSECINRFDSILRIIWEDEPENLDRCVIKGIRLMPEVETDITLADCYDMAVENGYRSGEITVINEWPLRGEVYEFGNHGEYWEKVGKTEGYA